MFLLIGWTIIYFGIIYENWLKDYFQRVLDFHQTYFLEWLPAVTTGLVNYIIPWILGKLTSCEEWDFAEEEIQSELWKNYWCTILNIIFFLQINFEDLLKPAPMEKNTSYNCKEDSLTDNLLKLWIFELAFRYVFYLYWHFHWTLKSKIKEGFEYRQEFEVIDELVWIYFFYLAGWLTQLVYPIMCVVCIPVLYFHTRYLFYRLRHQKKQPAVASNDYLIGKTMNKYLTLTFIIVLIWYSIFLYTPLPRFYFWNLESKAVDKSRHCGPFNSNNKLSPMEEIGFTPNKGSVVEQILKSIVVQLCCYIFLVLLYYHEWKQIEILKDIKAEK